MSVWAECMPRLLSIAPCPTLDSSVAWADNRAGASPTRTRKGQRVEPTLSRQEEQAALVAKASEIPGVAAALEVYAQALRARPPATPVPRVRYSTDSRRKAGL